METSEHIEQCFTDIRDYIEELKETIGSLGHLNKTISSTAQKGIRELESRLAQVERERDAAVEDAKLGTACDTCWYNENQSLPNPCATCGGGFPMWQWRGVCEENTKEEEK